MDIWKAVIIACLIFEVEGRAGVDAFLKGFVENERKPTMVVFHGICWKSSVKVHVMKELSKAGIRSSPSMSEGPSLQDHALLLLTDLDCPGTAEVFQNATRRSLQRLPYRWLAVTSAPAQSWPLWEPFLVDSELVVAEIYGAGYRMTELHKPAHNMPTIFTLRGFFQGILTDVRPHRELFRRRCDVMGAPMTMANGIQDSNSSIYHLLQEDSLELQYDVISKNGWTIAKLGFLMLNATPKAVFNSRFGYFQNGQWNGIIKDLIDYKADMATNVGMNKLRLSVVTYIDPMDNSRARFIFRQPTLSRTANIFSLPFSSGVWVATAISSFVAAVAFCLSTRLTRKGNQDGIMGEAFLLTMGALSQQGCEVQPKNISARIVLWVLFTSLMSLYAAYSANIVVLLQAPSSSVNNLAQLAKSKITLGAYDADYNHAIFKGVANPIRQEISRKISPENGPRAFYKLAEGVEKIRKGLFAYHSLVEPVYRQIEKTFQESEKCDLMEVDYVGYSGLHAPASKSSPYLELMRVAFKRIREVGIKSAINFRYEARKPSCKDSIIMFSSVGVTELRPVLLFMSYGVGLSVIVAAVEFVVFYVPGHCAEDAGGISSLYRNADTLCEEAASSSVTTVTSYVNQTLRDFSK